MVIFLGLLTDNLDAAIRYGDVDRIELVYTYLIPIFRSQGKNKYAYMLTHRKIMMRSILSTAQAYEMKMNSLIGEFRGLNYNIQLQIF